MGKGIRPARTLERTGTQVGASAIVLALLDGRINWWEAAVAAGILLAFMLVSQRVNPSGRPE